MRKIISNLTKYTGVFFPV